MTISGALSSALQGLRAAGAGSEVIATNLSNALTPEYAVRSLELSSDATSSSGGVKIDGITRQVNQSLLNDKRLADAGQANSSAVADIYSKIEKLIGIPDDPLSLSARLSTLEKNLITAASRPDAPERLAATVLSAKLLASSFNDASDSLQSVRTNADRTIATQVTQLNNALKYVQNLNTQITKTQSQNNNSSALLDQRQRIIDEISVIVPVRVIPRDNGQVALYSLAGATLLDGRAAEIGFEQSHIVTPYLRNDTGTLSGLIIDGVDVRTGSNNGALPGGVLAAQFAIRDEIAVEAQSELDALARNLVERFQDPSVDASLSNGAPGLFTDDDQALSPIDEVGIAQRLKVNASVDPDQGGEVWRLRDGIAATAPGDVSDATLLNALTSALSTGRTVSSGKFTSGVFSAIDLTATIASDFGVRRMDAEQRLSFSAAQANELTERLLGDGVDSDQELQKLLTIEQTFAANARMIQALDEMMQTLLRI